MSGETVPKPFPEARPPHIPNALTRQSQLLVVFALIAIYELVSGWRSWSGEFPIPSADQVPLLAHALIPSAIVPLIAVVLFLRRPDARRSMPLLVFGLSLLTVVTLVEDFDSPIYAMLIGDDISQSASSPGLAAYTVLKSLLRLVGLVYVGAGIAAARREPATAMQRPLSIWLGALAVVAILLAPLGPASALSAPTTADLIAAGIGLILSLLVTLAWAYLASMTVGGWLAGETPNRAWGLGALAVTYLLAYRIFGQLVLWFGEAARPVSVIASYVSLAAWVLLLIAFAIGLPSPPAGDDAVSTTADPQAATPPGS